VDERQAERVADAMFALSTPSRVQILVCLMDGPRSVSELVDELGFEQSSVSHQLRVLREHALVRAERVGRHRVYGLADAHVTALLEQALRHVDVGVHSDGRSGKSTHDAASRPRIISRAHGIGRRPTSAGADQIIRLRRESPTVARLGVRA
jgi:DNA-binding transcriptional ArsR family regulator